MYYTFELTELTPEEQAEAERITKEYFSYRSELLAKRKAAAEAGEDITEIDAKLTDIIYNDPSLRYLEEAEKRHFASFNSDLDVIYADALERIKRLINRDMERIFTGLERQDLTQEDVDTLLTADAIRGRIRYNLTMHLGALEADPKRRDKVMAEITKQAKKAADLATDPGQIPGQLSLFDTPGKKTPSGHKHAEAQGAITTLNGYIQFISNKNYQHALTSKPNKYAYIVDGGPDLMRDIISENIETDGGLLHISDDNMVKLANNEAVKPIDTPLLSAFLTAAQLSNVNKSEKDPYVMVYLPHFCRELGIRLKTLDPKTAEDLGVDIAASDGSESVTVEDSNKNSNDFWKRLDAIQGYIGILKQSSYVRCINIVRFDRDTQILYLDFPYFKFVKQEIEEDPETKIYTKKDHNLIYEKKNYNTLIHSDITSAKNRTAALIAIEIINRVLQRGGDPDAKLTQNKKTNYSDTGVITTVIKCSDIVNAIPDFKNRLDNMRSYQTARDKTEKNILNQQNLALKKAFSGAYDLLREKTDIYEYYTHLEITPVIPTMRTLTEKKITIKHRGNNPNYEKGSQEQTRQKRKSDRLKKTLNKGS